MSEKGSDEGYRLRTIARWHGQRDLRQTIATADLTAFLQTQALQSAQRLNAGHIVEAIYRGQLAVLQRRSTGRPAGIACVFQHPDCAYYWVRPLVFDEQAKDDGVVWWSLARIIADARVREEEPAPLFLIHDPAFAAPLDELAPLWFVAAAADNAPLPLRSWAQQGRLLRHDDTSMASILTSLAAFNGQCRGQSGRWVELRLGLTPAYRDTLRGAALLERARRNEAAE